MLSSNTNFDAKHAEENKAPIYFATFSRSGWSPSFSTICTRNATDTSYKTLIVGITGGQQNVAPEKGTASISGYNLEVIDPDSDILGLIADDDAQMHNVTAVLKAGYLGTAEADLLTIFTGQVTGIKENANHTGWVFTLSDPSKKLQKHIGWDATDASPVTFSGNPIDILLKILTSTGAGTNGSYDVYDASNGVGISSSLVSVSEMEDIRDLWFPGSAFDLQIQITEHVKAKTLIETEILKLINAYPRIDGQGRYSIIPFKPTMSIWNTGDVQSYNEDNIISWNVDLNFRETINEVEVKYDWDGSDFQTITSWADATSINLRSVGKAPMVIESKGLKASYNGSASQIAESRKSRIFSRYTTPPLKLTLKTFFSQWLTEAGDIVPVTHSRIKDPVAGSVGLTAKYMEVVKRSIDWRRGTVDLELVETGFSAKQYGVISPCMTIVSGTSATEFEVNSTDAAKFAALTNPEVDICRDNGLYVATVTVTDVTGTTVTVDSIGETPAANWTARFAAYDSCTTEQKQYAFISDGSDYLGAADDDCHIITP